MDAQQQDQAAFEQGFASVTGTEPPPPAAASTEAPAGVEVAPAPEPAEPNAPEPAEAPEGEPAAAPAPEGQAPKEQGEAEEDPVVFDGFRRSEVRRLLGNAAEVESLKRQLDKAHGNIGELNRRFQQAAQPVPAATPAQVPELPPELKQFEADFPEAAQYVRALVSTPKQERQEAPPAEVQQPAAAGEAQPAQAGPDPMALELAVMDRMHKGWREKVNSQDFNLWLTAQGEQAQSAFDAAQTADDMAGVIGQFDQWATARTAAADKAAKGQQRLKAAVTPTGNAPRPQAAPTEQEAFVAGFKSVMAR